MKKLFSNLKGSSSKKKIEDKIEKSENIINESFEKAESLTDNKNEIEQLKKKIFLEIENLTLDFENAKEKLKNDFLAKEKAIIKASKKVKVNLIVSMIFLIIIAIVASMFFLDYKLKSYKALINSKDSELSNQQVEIDSLNQQINQFEAKNRSLEQYSIIEKSALVNNSSKFLYTSENKDESNNYIKSLETPSYKEYEDKGNYFVYRKMSDEYINNLGNNKDAIYPGAIILGETATSPNLALVSLPRTNLDITSNFTNTNIAATTETVYDVNLANVRNAINKIVKKNILSKYVTNMSYNDIEITKEFNIVTGLNLGIEISKLNAAFNNTIDLSNKKTNRAITFEQTYYDINTIAKPQPIEYFKQNNDLSSLGSFSPVYVSEVSYGRKGVLFISTKASSTEINEALKAAGDISKIVKKITVGSVNVGNVLNAIGLENEDMEAVAEAKIKIKKIFNESKINVIIEGGSNTNASIGINSIESFLEFWCAGFDSKELEYAVPVSYQLKNLVDNKLVDQKSLNVDNIVPKNSLLAIELKEIKLENNINPLANIENESFIVNFDAIGTVITPLKADGIFFNNDKISSSDNETLLTDIGIDSRLILKITDTSGSVVEFEIPDADKEKLMLKNIPIGVSELNVEIKTDSGKATLFFTINNKPLIKKSDI